LGLGILGGYIGYKYDKWDAQLVEILNEKRMNRGLPPFNREDIVSFRKG
jgi:hypothetical protein